MKKEFNNLNSFFGGLFDTLESAAVIREFQPYIKNQIALTVYKFAVNPGINSHPVIALHHASRTC